MLSRFVRIQLIIFGIASFAGITSMVLLYMQAPAMLGIGRITVTLELPNTGSLYRFGNVTYRGTEVGKVLSVMPTERGAEAKLSISSSPQIPVDLEAEVRSVSAIGEQYVELRPRTDAGPFLRNGSVITQENTSVPQRVGPMLDQVSELIRSIPKDRLGELLNESSKGLDGAGYDLGSLFDSSERFATALNGVSEQTRDLMEQSAPLLDSQATTTDEIRQWSRNLAGVTDQMVANDGEIRTIMQSGPGALDEATKLLDQLKPTLPILLANLTSLGQVAVTYHPSLEQVLVLLPPLTAFYTSNAPFNNLAGLPTGDFRLTISDPPACTVGFLPPSAWRAPEDTTEADTPDGLYCKLPQDSPLSVRGARNYPCMGHPGKRAPTVQICDSDKPFEPVAERPHTVGPYPFDPNLVAQGIPLDPRVNPGENIYGPPEGTPPAAPFPEPTTGPPPVPPNAPLPTPSGTSVPAPTTATPNGYTDGGVGTSTPVATAQYDPGTGKYMAPGGTVYQDLNLAHHGEPRTWQELVLAAG